jgi:hypothetical protein
MPSHRAALLLVAIAFAAFGLLSQAAPGWADSATLTPVADTYVQDDRPDENFASATFLRVGEFQEFCADARAFVRFDLSAIPANATINSATLRLYLRYGNAGSKRIDVHRIAESWNLGTVTWNNQPSYSAASYAYALVGTTNAWYTWDVTTLVSFWNTGYYTNHGFALDGLLADCNWREFDSLTGANAPQLVIDYTLPTATPTRTATQTATRTPSLTLTAAGTLPSPTPSRTHTPSSTPSRTPTATPTLVPASIGGRVWHDADRDGHQDAGEAGLAGVRLDLLEAGVSLDFEITDAAGDYVFAGVAPGPVYRVDADDASLPGGYTLTTHGDPLIMVPAPGQDIRTATARRWWPTSRRWCACTWVCAAPAGR